MAIVAEKNPKKHQKSPKMLIQGHYAKGSGRILPFLSSDLDSPWKNTIYMFSQIQSDDSFSGLTILNKTY